MSAHRENPTALRRARVPARLENVALRLKLTDTQVEDIFYNNARRMLGIDQGDKRHDDARGQELYQKGRKIIPGGTQLLSKRPEIFLPEQWPT